MSITVLKRRAFAGTAAAAVSLAAMAAGLMVAPAAEAASVAATLSASSGPSGGLNTLTATTTTAKFYSGSTFVSFQVKAATGSTCAAYWTAAAAVTATTGVVVVASPKILSSTKLAVTVPSTVALPGSATSLGLNLCVYNGNTAGSTTGTANALIVNAGYTIAAKPTVSAISPSSGPALGGGTVTVTGTNFISGLTASIGGTALTGVTIVSATTFTATVPAHAAASNLTLSVTTTGGTANRTSAYSYSNGIVVAPATTPTATAATDLDVLGVGFTSMTFDDSAPSPAQTSDGSAPDGLGAHVYIVDGDYDSLDNSGAKTLGETGECLNVLVVSDTELICTLNTNKAYGQVADSAIANGTYTITVVSDGAVDAVTDDSALTQSIVSSGSTFTVAPY